MAMFNHSSTRIDRGFGRGFLLCCALIVWSPAIAQVPDARGNQIPVVAQISKAQVTTKGGRKFDAKLVGCDPATDIAVLQLQGPRGDLKTIQMGDSDKIEVGDFVIAIGNPFGLGETVTSGIVSALGHTGLGKQGYEDFNPDRCIHQSRKFQRRFS
jgi:hypothetical protein